jgi:hypothetical protein
MTLSDRAHRIVDGTHLVYLGLLPALATFAILAEHGHSAVWLAFFGGIIAVSVYLAVAVSYTRSPGSLIAALLILLDGPVCALLAQSDGKPSFSFAIESFLIEGIAIWLAIIWLAVTTNRPTQEQRIATIGFACIAVGTMLSVFWPYLRGSVWGDWQKSGWLAVGIVEAVLTRHYLLETDEVVRGEGISAPYIGILLFVWIAALIAGNVLHEVL